MKRIPLAGVLGAPIGHSKSPLMQNHWLKTYNIKGIYSPIEIAQEDLHSFFQLAPRLGFVGFNVTVPHKQAAATLCGSLSDTARRAGSVNTVSFAADGEAYGDSTDGYGFLRNLEDLAGWRPEGKTVAMLGAGGAARAVAAAVIDGGAKNLRLSNRSADRAEDLQAAIGGPVELAPWPVNETFWSDVDLVVNATSLGMEGGPDWRWEIPALPSTTIATDLIYTPLVTPFLAAAKASGARIVDGLGMLLHQGVPGFERWFGLTPEVTPELRELVLTAEGPLP